MTEASITNMDTVTIRAERYNQLVVSANHYRVLVESVIGNIRWYNEQSAEEPYNGYVLSAELLMLAKNFEPDKYARARKAYFARKKQEDEKAAKEKADWKAKLIAEKVQGDIWSGDEADKPGDEEEEL